MTRRAVPIEVLQRILDDHASERAAWQKERALLLDRLSEALGRGLPATGRREQVRPRVPVEMIPENEREAHMVFRDVGQMP